MPLTPAPALADEQPGPSQEQAQGIGQDLQDARDRLADRGVTFEASLIADFSKNISGGAGHGRTSRHLFDFSVELDMGALAGIEGGTFFADFQTQAGQDGSVQAGDLQAYSNIDAPGFTALYEVWYQHVLLDGGARIKAGKIDANSEFAFVEHGSAFIHSSAGFSPTLFILPTYPDPAFGIVGMIGQGMGLYAGAGLFDGALQEGVSTGTRGPATLLGSPGDLFLIGEVGYVWGGGIDALPGRVAGGVWHHTGTFMRFSGGTQSNTTGIYFALDQMIYNENSDPAGTQGIGLFAQYGWADPELSAVEHHAGLGVQWIGAVDGRNEDVLGLSVSWAALSDEPGAGLAEDAETALELFYKLQLGPNLSVKPDLQYITNPGGGGLDDAWVTTLRLELMY